MLPKKIKMDIDVIDGIFNVKASGGGVKSDTYHTDLEVCLSRAVRCIKTKFTTQIKDKTIVI